MQRLENAIQPYAWGSHTALAELQGRSAPSATPEAELWMGAHPGAPSRLAQRGGTLLDWLQAAPAQTLGTPIVERYGATLPFLLKVLAAEQPLSLQAHPSLAQAREGYARENAQQIPLRATYRNYKDANHKPELLCALTPFEALCGFRDARETLALFDALGAAELEELLAPLRAAPEAQGLARTFERLMSLPAARRGASVGAAVAACERLAQGGGPWAGEARWALRLAELYPGDPGVIGSLLFNLLHLQPGEAIYLPAGNLHAYLNGVGVEIMANSDNVLRGGCTPKHVDVAELLHVLDFRCGPVTPLRATPLPGEGEEVFQTPAPEFRLSRLRLEEGRALAPSRRGPEILLCTEGEARVSLAAEQVLLPRGESVFVAACEGAYSVSGRGMVSRATVGELSQQGI